MGIINTDDRFAWLPTYVESWVQGTVWKMSTVASICRAGRKMFKKYMEKTGANMGMLDYKLHNFGDRAAGSPEEAVVIAGIAHAALFSGSDCLRANSYIKRLYRTAKPYLSSVEAFEHSTICANSDADTKDDFGGAVKAVERLQDVVAMAKAGVGIPLLSVVIDTYDSTRFVGEYLGTRLRDEIQSSGGMLVARPDSGDPTVEPGRIGRILADKFGSTRNAEGFEVLAPCVGVIQGDGIRISTLEAVIQGWIDAGFSLDNFVLGMGSGTTNDCQRDDFSWSMKAVATQRNGQQWTRQLKDPVTGSGKKSLSGLIRCRETENGLEVFDALAADALWSFEQEGPGWRLWFENGYRRYSQSFDDVRARAQEGL